MEGRRRQMLRNPAGCSRHEPCEYLGRVVVVTAAQTELEHWLPNALVECGSSAMGAGGDVRNSAATEVSQAAPHRDFGDRTHPGAPDLALFFSSEVHPSVAMPQCDHPSLLESQEFHVVSSLNVNQERRAPSFALVDPLQLDAWIDSLVGCLIGGRFLVERCLAKGGMGIVLLCRDSFCAEDKTETTASRVAVKIMRPDVQEREPQLARRFGRECEAANRLPAVSGLARVIDQGTDLTLGTFIAMEWVRGRTLTSYVREHGPLPARMAAELARQLTRTLAQIAEAGIVHRDLKPANILIDHRGDVLRAVLLDFGICCFVDSQDPALTTSLTEPGVLVGTLGYMAPEQLVGSSALTPATDRWALGAIVYFAATGHHPYEDAPNAQELFEDKALGPPMPIEHYAADAPAELSMLLSDLMVKDVDARPSCQAILARLDHPSLTQVSPSVAPLPPVGGTASKLERDGSGFLTRRPGVAVSERAIALDSSDLEVASDSNDLEIALDSKDLEVIGSPPVSSGERPTGAEVLAAISKPMRSRALSPMRALELGQARAETYLVTRAEPEPGPHWAFSAAVVIALGVLGWFAMVML